MIQEYGRGVSKGELRILEQRPSLVIMIVKTVKIIGWKLGKNWGMEKTDFQQPLEQHPGYASDNQVSRRKENCS